MTTQQAPERWIDAAEPALRDAIRAERDAGPSEAELLHLIAAVEKRLMAGPTPDGTHVPQSAQRHWHWLVPVGIIVTAGVLWLLHARPVEVAPAHVKVSSNRAHTDTSTQSASASAVSDTNATPAAAPSEQSTAPLKTKTLRRTHKPAAAARSTEPDTVANTAAADPLGEVQLLLQAKRMLATAPARALDLLAEHKRSYEHGQFVEEREALTVEALFATHQTARARTQEASFRARFPSSVYLRRIQDRYGAGSQLPQPH